MVSAHEGGKSALKGLLNMGLGRLGLPASTRPRLANYDVVLVFVVGGISLSEVRQVKQRLEDHLMRPRPHIIVGGTSLLTPDAATAQFFAAATAPVIS